MPVLEAESPAMRSDKFSKLNEALANLVQNFGLVNFEVLAVENKKSMMHLLRVIDRAGGYVFGSAEGANDTVWQVAMRDESSLLDVPDLQDRWIDNKEFYDQKEREDEERAQTQIQEQQAAAAEASGGVVPPPPPVLDSGIKVARKQK